MKVIQATLVITACVVETSVVAVLSGGMMKDKHTTSGLPSRDFFRLFEFHADG